MVRVLVRRRVIKSINLPKRSGVIVVISYGVNQKFYTTILFPAVPISQQDDRKCAKGSDLQLTWAYTMRHRWQTHQRNYAASEAKLKAIQAYTERRYHCYWSISDSCPWLMSRTNSHIAPWIHTFQLWLSISRLSLWTWHCQLKPAYCQQRRWDVRSTGLSSLS